VTTVDYLRIATWELKAYTHLSAKIRSNFHGKWEPRHWLQYAGYGNADASIFMGSGEQQGERHYVFQCSGQKSQEFFGFIMGLGLSNTAIYCTRLDIQQTIPHPPVLLRKVFKQNGRKAKTWIESDSQTIYIGSRTSDRFTRLYQKIDQHFLRLEHELKGKLARSVFATCQIQTAHASILHNQFIYSTNKCKFGAWVGKFFNLSPEILKQEDVSVDEELERRLKRQKTYLKNTEIALEKYMNNHDLGEQVRQMIDRLHRMGQHRLDE